MKEENRILVVDDEQDVGRFFKYFLKQLNFDTVVAHNIKEARQSLEQSGFQVIMLDLKLPDGSGLDLLRDIKQHYPGTHVIIMTGYSTVQSAVEAIKLGAFDYVEKPFDDLDTLEELVVRAMGTKPWQTEETEESREIRAQLGFITGGSETVKRLISVAERVAGKNITVLIRGETGTGKEVLARYVHCLSKRRHQPFVPVNCGALAETLLESELFGHEKGSFTGAHAARRGVFEIADRGSLFLDEIGDASMSVQVKLLRALDSGQFTRIGSERLLQTDCRVIAATNVDLEEAVAKKNFRKDLLYRLNVVTLELPPLRERVEDIPYLAKHLAMRQSGNRTVHFSPGAINKLQIYSWPGNIREMANVISQAMALTAGNIIEESNLRINAVGKSSREMTVISTDPQMRLQQHLEQWLAESYHPNSASDLQQVRGYIERAEDYLVKKILIDALRDTLGDRTQAAKKLNISPRTLRYLLREK
ncbi:sigma-54 dependent transcriptional regulator [Metallumcola ferriviriculae]|uniref:Stage 0 sporulation protein A homolog n=1 Tax=Metallumcola ferriviriculae TaxID=3039180 RepID=A0AAU0US63_9FIRM|nr:sigma-54 dependent transcriptional regulator [Desulfitibacteraceae bacterium MK1]